MKRLWVGALLVFSCVTPTRTARAPALNEPVLQVLTYNLNYGIAGDESTVAAILERDADVVLLQETNARWQQALQPLLSKRYPGQAWLDGQAASGMAILSKHPLEAKALANPNGWFPAIRAVTDTPLGRVQLLGVHLHPPVSESGSWVSGYLSTGGVRRDEMAHFLAKLDPSMPTIVAGDFNEDARGDALQLLERHGLRTALPELHPAAKTWRWPLTQSLELTAQLDHVAYGPELEPIDARVTRTGNSDHFPVVVDFVRAQPNTLRPPPPSRGGSVTLTSY